MMSENIRSSSLSAQVMELLQLFGPAPVLTSENIRAYEKMVGQLLESFAPPDFMAQILVKEVADSTWEATRLARHKTLLIERRVADRRNYQAQRGNDVTQSKEASVNKPAAQSDKASADPEDVLEGLVEKIDEIVLNPVAELDHARALEVGIVYYEHLNKEQLAALARRNIALDQLERHLDAHTLRHVSDRIIDAGMAEELPKQVAAPPVISAEQ